MSSPNPIFSFAQQCQKEWELSQEWFLVCKEAIKWKTKGKSDIAMQMIENFKLLAYREWKKSFDQVDCKDNAIWRENGI